MKKYECGTCSYSTHYKSNFNKHMNSKAHAKKSLVMNKNPTNESKILPSVFQCKECSTVYSSASNLTRHMKSCNKNNDEFIKLKTKVNQLENALKIKDIEMENKEKDLQIKFQAEKIKDLTALINSGRINTTYNISVQKYIQQTYPNAPHLVKLDNYAALKEKEEEDDEDDKFAFENALIRNYNQNKLHHYLGNFIIQHYKKEDPKKQSIWNSDVSRLTYIVKELLAGKESCWSQDPKGVKTKKYIIDPLLDYISKYCTLFMEAHQLDREDAKDMEIRDIFAEKSNILGNIICEVRNGSLAASILKYMASRFRINRGNTPIDDTIDEIEYEEDEVICDKIEYDNEDNNDFIDDDRIECEVNAFVDTE